MNQNLTVAPMPPRLISFLVRKSDSLKKRPKQYIWDLVRKVVHRAFKWKKATK